MKTDDNVQKVFILYSCSLTMEFSSIYLSLFFFLHFVT